MLTFEWSVVIPASVVSALISALASYAVAKHTSKVEIRKMKLVWSRQDTLSDESAIQNALSSVSLYLHADEDIYYEQALAHVAAALGVCSGPLGEALSALHSALAHHNDQQAEEAYSAVVTLCRQPKRRS